MSGTTSQTTRNRHAPPTDVRTARLVLNAISNVGPVTCRRLLDALGGDPVAIFRATRAQLLAVKEVGETIADSLLNWHDEFDPNREIAEMEKRNLRFVIPEDGDAYPPLLRQIYDPPLGLYTSGEFKWGAKCVAIVGTRYATAYGKLMARTLARELAASGWCVVSGLASGIDTAAHQGALEAGGATVAVLGCGPDIVYPAENLALYREIIKSGLLVSEFSLGKNANKQTFPMRNRIVSGMSRAVVVVESAVKGGSMITARFAGEQGRLVCAVPGRADLSSSRGCHTLIRDGATLVTCVDEILEELGAAPKGGAKNVVQTEFTLGESATTYAANPNLGAEERNILQKLSGGIALGADALAEQTGIPVHTLFGKLLMMELDRLIVKNADGSYEAK